MSKAFVFPGQGAQTLGMGRDLADAWPDAAAIFAEVDDALGEPLSELIWGGDADALTLTENAQPALMATSMAAMAALSAEGQVLVVTHSPQVAALGAHHWRVEKRVVDKTTLSTVVPLAEADRVDEIARMVSGDTITDEARAAARALLTG
jgi:acyl transferase domain-containing protein